MTIRRVRPEDVEAFRRLAAEGMTQKEIAKATGFCKNTVWRHLTAQLTASPRLADVFGDDIRRLHAEGHGQKAISEMVGVSGHVVATVLTPGHYERERLRQARRHARDRAEARV